MNGDNTLKEEHQELIQQTCTTHFILLAAISIWEITMLHKKNRISLTQPIHQWLDKVASLPFIKITPLSINTSIESCFLPGDFQGDTADRMIAATARVLDIPLLTRDPQMITYATNSYLKVIAC